MNNIDKKNTGIILMNLGTPNSPKLKDVRKYLKEFLFDPKIINLPTIPRWILVNIIIIPFRAKKSAHAYKTIWSENTGSPLKYYTESLKNQVSNILNIIGLPCHKSP